MKYQIIEDCSPYYIRFTHNNVKEVVDYSNLLLKNYKFEKGFTHQKIDPESIETLMSKIPMSDDLDFNFNRTAFFVTQPGHYYRAHKDGLDTRCGINYTIKIQDNKCITNWYSDEDLKNYKIDNMKYLPHYKNNPVQYNQGISREIIDFKKNNHIPIKSMIAQPNECILFNTEIFHDFDNSASDKDRIVLTLRFKDAGTVFFDDIKNYILKNQINI
jgi:hypothetical protein